MPSTLSRQPGTASARVPASVTAPHVAEVASSAVHIRPQAHQTIQRGAALFQEGGEGIDDVMALLSNRRVIAWEVGINANTWLQTGEVIWRPGAPTRRPGWLGALQAVMRPGHRIEWSPGRAPSRPLGDDIDFDDAARVDKAALKHRPDGRIRLKVRLSHLLEAVEVGHVSEDDLGLDETSFRRRFFGGLLS